MLNEFAMYNYFSEFENKCKPGRRADTSMSRAMVNTSCSLVLGGQAEAGPAQSMHGQLTCSGFGLIRERKVINCKCSLTRCECNDGTLTGRAYLEDSD